MPRGNGGNAGQGSKWIRPEKRLAIYLRDGLLCAWCGADGAAGHRLTLDHLTPRNRGGGNCERNLVTCCVRCNAGRRERSYRAFVRKLVVPPVARFILAEVDRRRRLDLGPFRDQVRKLAILHPRVRVDCLARLSEWAA